MKLHALPFLLLLFAFRAASSWAGEIPSGSVSPKDTSYGDFCQRLKAAVKSGEFASIAALYQTNDVSAAEMKSELVRWRQVLRESGEQVSTYFKPLSKMPPESESHRFWTAQAHRLTRHGVTDFAILNFSSRVQLIVPLVLTGDRLLIVPSEKIVDKGVEPGSPKDPATGLPICPSCP